MEPDKEIVIQALSSEISIKSKQNAELQAIIYQLQQELKQYKEDNARLEESQSH